jgi:hypothetical protein
MNTPTIDSVIARLQEHSKGLPEGLQPNVAGMRSHYFRALVADRVGAALFVKELNDIADHVDAKIWEMTRIFEEWVAGMEGITDFVKATMKKQEEISIWIFQGTHTLADFDALEAERAEFFKQHAKAQA